MKYTVIKTEEQYVKYCDRIMLLESKKASKENEDEIELLDLLIEKWHEVHYKKIAMDPIALLKYVMNQQKMKSIELAELLGISKSAVSQILSYKKGLSKEVIRKLCDRFKVQQEAFNRPYKLKGLKPAAKKMPLKKKAQAKKKTVRKAA